MSAIRDGLDGESKGGSVPRYQPDLVSTSVEAFHYDAELHNKEGAYYYRTFENGNKPLKAFSGEILSNGECNFKYDDILFEGEC